jgi:hypothetical protein
MEARGAEMLFERRSTNTIGRRSSPSPTGSGSTGDASVSGLVSTLVPTLIIAIVMVTVFLFLRRTQKRQYAPRTYLGSLRPQERSPALSNSLFGWISEMRKVG